MLNMAIVKQFTDIFVNKGSTIIADNLIGNDKSTNYVLTDEISTARPVAFFNGIALTHFVKYSVATNIQI